ncbi:MAG: sigma-E factor negative regulatory protein [Betaproteobacteria bacterium]|nr:sigma-E factor negative regulatory protein [Betaproteobacteria bacterium]
MNERISALMDGEVDNEELGNNLKRLASDGEWRDTWETYHLIGDALRGHSGPGYAAKVAARLAKEPTVLAPKRVRSSAQRARWLAMSVAAGLAAVVLVAWMAVPQSNQESAPALAAAPASAPETSASAGLPATPVAAEVEDYLLAHQPFSPSGAMQGVATYVRTVADEGNR